MIEATYGRAGELTWVGQRYSFDYFAGQPLVKKAIDMQSSRPGDGATFILRLPLAAS